MTFVKLYLKLEKETISFQFRNLDKLTKENIKEIIEEVDLIELMEKLENEE